MHKALHSSNEIERVFVKRNGKKCIPITGQINVPQRLAQAAIIVTVNGKRLSVILDSCSTEYYISKKVVQKQKLKIQRFNTNITISQEALKTRSKGYVVKFNSWF